jgi:hypothetical protein
VNHSAHSPAGSTPLTVCFEDRACNASSWGNEAKPPVAYKADGFAVCNNTLLLRLFRFAVAD